MKSLFFQFLFLFLSTVIVAQDNPNKSQTTTIKIDLDKKTISAPFPFDEYVKLEIVSKNNEIVQKAEIIQISFVEDSKGEIIKVPHEDRNSYRKGTSTSPLKNIIKINIKKVKNHNYKAIIDPVLLPNESYEIIFRKKLNNEQMNTFYQIIEYVKNGQHGSARILFNQKIAPLDKEEHRAVPINNIQPFSFYTNNLDATIQGYINGSQPLDTTSISISAAEIKDISNKLNDKKISTSAFSNVMLEFINTENNYDINKVCKGLKLFSSDKACKNFEYGKILNNLKMSLDQLEELDKDLKKLIILYAGDASILSFYTSKFSSIKTTLKGNLNKIENLTAKISKDINRYYSYGEIITNSTYSSKDKENAPSTFVSDFGFINSWGRDRLGNVEYIGRPYFGLNYHFRGINKDKKIDQVANKRLPYRFSIALGVTIGKIDENEYTDFFNNLSPSLGINYRLTPHIRLGAGGLVVRKNRNPIIQKESISVLPYVSISFDYSLLKDLVVATRIFN